MAPKEPVRSFLWLILYAVCTYFFVSFVAPYFGAGDPLEQRRLSEICWLAAHFIFGFFALFLAPLQFFPAIRAKYPRMHRTIGKIYIIGTVGASCLAFYLLSSYPFPGSLISLVFLDIIWLFTTILAWLFAKRQRFPAHRQFMIRSYVCALTFVYLRLFDKIDHYTGMLCFIKDEETRATVIDWLWIFPVMITEFFLTWFPDLKKLKRNNETGKFDSF